MTEVFAPVSGTVVSLAETEDPVFAGGIVGPGCAIRPLGPAETAVAPVAGTIVKIHPHAYVIGRQDGHSILVHLGVNTVQLGGKGFEVIAHEGDQVEVGDPVTAWTPSEISGEGITSTVLVVALEKLGGSVDDVAEGTVAQGAKLFEVQ